MVCVLIAAFVRGYSGFGFSLLAITSMSLATPLAVVMPAIFMMEVAASLSLLPTIWRDVHWRDLMLLWLGCLVATPLGVWFLATVPTAPMKVALGIAVLGAVALLWSGYRRKSMPTPTEIVLTGGLAGLLNGAFGIVTPVVVFFFNSPAGAVVGRASLIAFFIGTDVMGLAFLAQQGLVTSTNFVQLLIFLPPLMIGQWVGARQFKSADEATFKLWVLRLLALLAVLTAGQGTTAMLRSPS
jgi:uncharacterized membrane protein YfcA